MESWTKTKQNADGSFFPMSLKFKMGQNSLLQDILFHLSELSKLISMKKYLQISSSEVYTPIIWELPKQFLKS